MTFLLENSFALGIPPPGKTAGTGQGHQSAANQALTIQVSAIQVPAIQALAIHVLAI